MSWRELQGVETDDPNGRRCALVKRNVGVDGHDESSGSEDGAGDAEEAAAEERVAVAMAAAEARRERAEARRGEADDENEPALNPST